MIDQNFKDELRARTPLHALVGRRVKLSRSGRNWKGCCPFHNEKTPSFYVYEDSFHCFGCGANGDAIEFVMRTEGASFIEAIEKLAAEAGLEVPAPTPQAAIATRQRADIYEVLAQAANFYREALYGPTGTEGLAYLRRRGLTEETIAGFGLGWSGAGRGALTKALAAKDISPEQIQAAGLLRHDENGAPIGELFFNRVMFPIKDRAGKILSFGGRILGDGQPKYVNGPESSVFSKRRTLYGLDRARAGMARGDTLIVVEGYMDVIVLHQAGFCGAVAPLGTALTEEQLEQLWRLSPLPHLCFDGDNAGSKAASRAAILALPHITPEKSLKIVFLPNGDDPDSVVTTRGGAAFTAMYESAETLNDALYGLLQKTTGIASPEQRARFRTALAETAALIRDKSLSSEYRSAWFERFFAARKAKNFKQAAPRAARPTPDDNLVASERARTLTAVIINHPSLLVSLEEAWLELPLPRDLARLREAILHFSAHHGTIHTPETDPALDSAHLIDHLTSLGLAQDVHLALGDRPFVLPGFVAPGAMKADAAAGFWHIWGLMHPGRLDEEVEAAYRDYLRDPSEQARVRWQSLLRERERYRRGRLHDGIGDDGASLAEHGFADGSPD